MAYNDGNVPFGSQSLTIGATAYIAVLWDSPPAR
jgi:hypothetical protein